jgi:hypothetical protein
MTVQQEKASIRALRPNVSDSEALRLLNATSLSNFFWKLRKGPLLHMAAAYVPFALYPVSYQMGPARVARFFAIDQVDGSLDLFEFPKLSTPDDLVSIETANRIPASLEDDRAQYLLQEKVLRIVFQQGFFRLQRPELRIDTQALQFHIPYWLGFYGPDGSLSCRVLDAVRRRMEGDKATLLFEHWLKTEKL